VVDPAQPALGSDAPAVVWLGYSVHGNETSSGEAAMLTAYYLAANRDAQTGRWLDEAVVVIDPAQNPDGRDRAANWHNAWGGSPASPDPADKEHVEPFPQGRVNHYFTDLNRDWLALAQADSWPKVEHFHRWYPNIQIDFHEMGKDSTYYFEPSPRSMESPLLPSSSYEANHWLARFHAQALDDIGSLYYTGENFDNFSPIYGSTYPDFHGAVGVTVEQASSRGLVQESVNGPLHFNFTIRNQVATGLASVRGAVEDKARLVALQKDSSARRSSRARPIRYATGCSAMPTTAR
jgi:Zinc carboxypeptidase.